jgi:chemotaxis protein methyltransferase CheR
VTAQSRAVTFVDVKADAIVERLADAVARRVGLRREDVNRKIAGYLAGIREAERPDHAELLMTAPSGGRVWIDFVERMLVHETYFFRHPAQLELLRDIALPDLDQRRRDAGRGGLVAWIAGCSTGEEAWTMALLAADACGGAVIPMSILATDISEAALAAARHGVYDRLHGLDSFRAIPPWAARHFADGRDRSAWRVPAALRYGVSFLRHNLLDPPPVAEADLIVCRNTLIYFDEGSCRRAQDNLAAALRPGGVLVLGSADTLRAHGAFELIETSAATVYRKRADGPP